MFELIALGGVAMALLSGLLYVAGIYLLWQAARWLKAHRNA